MAELEKTRTIAKETVEEMSCRLSEPTWLVDKRLQAWESYFMTPMPTPKDEGWKRLDITDLDLTRLKALSIQSPVQTDRATDLPEWLRSAMKSIGEPAGLLYQPVHSQGCLSLSESLRSKGVIFCDMATAIASHADKVQLYLDRQDSVFEGKFASLSRALFNCGLFLYVPRGLEIAEPFIYAVELDGSRGEAVLPRSLVVADELSKLTLIYVLGSRDDAEAHKAQLVGAMPCVAPPAEPKDAEVSAVTETSDHAEDEATLVSQLIETHVMPGAKVTYLEAQLQGSNVVMVNTSACRVDRDAYYESLTLALGGGKTKSDMATILHAPGAASELLGLVLGGGEEKFSFNTIQEHTATDTRSDINFRVALKDKSASVYQGIVRVAKSAQRTDAYQSNKNLLLDGTATADSIPKLEILADDVKCSHGATVGPVDREQIFYLMSRGVTRVIAEQLVVLGFFRQTLELFNFKGCVSWLSECVARKMQGGSFDSSASDFFGETDATPGETNDD